MVNHIRSVLYYMHIASAVSVLHVDTINSRLVSFYTDGSRVDLSITTAASIETTQNQQGVTTGLSTEVDISCDLGSLDIALCARSASNYLCFYVRPQPQTASFSEHNSTNNVKCISMSSLKICSPGKHL